MERVRLFIGIEALAFWTASAIHAGILLSGYQHRQAMIAEGVIGAVLAVGLAISIANDHATRPVGAAAQTVALLGTLIGIFTMVIGVGPHSRLDAAFHTLFVALLIPGIAIAGVGAHDRREVRY